MIGLQLALRIVLFGCPLLMAKDDSVLGVLLARPALLMHGEAANAARRHVRFSLGDSWVKQKSPGRLIEVNRQQFEQSDLSWLQKVFVLTEYRTKFQV